MTYHSNLGSIGKGSHQSKDEWRQYDEYFFQQQADETVVSVPGQEFV